MKKKNEENIDIKKALKLLIIVLIIIALFYGLTLLINRKSSLNFNDTNPKEIQNREILLGSSFNRKDNEYLVVYYNKSSNTTIAEAVANYRTKDDNLPTYEVDMGNGMNSSFISQVSNKEATKAEELQINGTTLIKFNNAKIVEYIESDSSVSEYLK